jgi:Protein of unknown function (DUF3386)
MATQPAQGVGDAAETLVRAAHARAYRYPEAFAGFGATIGWRVDERSGEGTVVARTGPEIQLELDADEADRAWVERELRSIVGHRQASTYDRGDGRHAKRVAEENGHALGVLVEIDDEYASSYRVTGDELSTVTRTIGDKRFTIVVHERAAMPDGTGLPKSFTVYYWDTDNGELKAAESYRDAAVEIDGVFLPASRLIVRGDSEGLSVRSLELTDHATLEGVER